MTIFKAEKVMIFEMTPAEAIRTIASLARQIDSRDMNTYRYELFTTDGVVFSIAVNCDTEQLKSASVAGK